VAAIVADYFAMLDKELRGIPSSKTAHRNALRPLLRDRSDGSIERKHQNISAILMEARFPYIRGYKPLSQYQSLLAEAVLERIEDDAVLSGLALTFADAAVRPPRVEDVLGLMKNAPEPLESVRSALADRNRRQRRAMRIDYLAREATNRSLGTKGEALVVTYERARLSSLGCDTLADRVEHVSVTRGDGLGYDVLSFSPDERERYIEVKTTQLGPMTPFYVTSSELRFSAEHHEAYSLYRVYQFPTEPLMFALEGRVDATCTITPAQYLAAPRAR
jgi:hypothetical protein